MYIRIYLTVKRQRSVTALQLFSSAVEEILLSMLNEAQNASLLVFCVVQLIEVLLLFVL